MPRFDANLSMLFGEVAFLDRFAAAADAGFRAVEFLFPYGYTKDRLGDVIAASGVEVVAFNMPPGDWEAGDRGLACDPRRRAEFHDGVGTAIEYAQALSCRRIHCMAGLRPRDVDDELVRETYLSNVSFAARELQARDVTLLVEVINPRDVPGYYLGTSRQAFALMDEIAAPNVRFQADLYHLQIVEGDLSHTLEMRRDRLGHVQIADTPGRHEPGTGEINYPFLFGHLDRIGYAGWVGCEYRPLTTTVEGLGWLAPYLQDRSTP
ncbi:hydroxypyruvate isomerase [Anaeromyxobacter oryzisoli]|uniref:hydroxypyruvate isomerase n=1 Tax=Anaeromyxobacter oryzisoli TaxID=2925408 RepID=UPI001F5A4FD1|nr:hydroxypyruvate isomerase [Anaeromyxobacter sp. SG63]